MELVQRMTRGAFIRKKRLLCVGVVSSCAAKKQRQMVTVVPCLGYGLGNSGFVFFWGVFLRRCRKSVRILKLKVPVFCGSDGISWKGHVTVAPSPKLGKGSNCSAISVTIGKS